MASCIMKPSMTCVNTFGLIIAFGRSFSTFTIVAPGVDFGGGPLGLLVTAVLAVVVGEVVEVLKVPGVLVADVVVIDVVQLAAELVLTAAGKLVGVLISSGEEETTAVIWVDDFSLSLALICCDADDLRDLLGDGLIPSVVWVVEATPFELESCLAAGS